jgi:hypothetical protein
MLADAISVCEASDAPISTLHAAEGVRPLYNKYGFKEIGTVHYARMTLPRGDDKFADQCIREASLAGDELARLLEIRSSFHQRLRLVGNVGRSESAWKSLVPLTGLTHVLLRGRGCSASDDGKDGPIVAYASVANKAGTYKLTDFGAADELTGPEARR